MKRHHEAYTEEQLAELAARLAAVIHGGAMIELAGDVGAGKTTFTKAFAAALGVRETVHSPTFTISNRYEISDGRVLAHYDFYRLSDPGVMAAELAETLGDGRAITMIEWADIVEGILPADRLTITLEPDSETTRELTLEARGQKSKELLEGL